MIHRSAPATTPGTAPPASRRSKLDPVADLQRLAAHLPPALAGDARQVRRAVAIAVRVGLHHGNLDDLSLAAAVVAERVGELDDVSLAGVYGAAHRESHRRATALPELEVPRGA